MENENLKDIIVKLEEKLSQVEVETLQTQINRLQQNLRKLQSEFELSESHSRQYQCDAVEAEEKLSDLQALHEQTLKKREKCKYIFFLGGGFFLRKISKKHTVNFLALR